MNCAKAPQSVGPGWVPQRSGQPPGPERETASAKWLATGLARGRKPPAFHSDRGADNGR